MGITHPPTPPPSTPREGKDSLGNLNAMEVKADIGSGLVMRRKFTILSPATKRVTSSTPTGLPSRGDALSSSGLRIESRIEAAHVGAGAGGFSR